MQLSCLEALLWASDFGRKTHLEAASLVIGRDEPDASSVTFGDMCDDREAESGTLRAVLAGIPSPEEALENVFLFLRRNAGSLIGYPNDGIVRFSSERETDVCAGRRILCGIFEEVLEHVGDAFTFSSDRNTRLNLRRILVI